MSTSALLQLEQNARLSLEREESRIREQHMLPHLQIAREYALRTEMVRVMQGGIYSGIVPPRLATPECQGGEGRPESCGRLGTGEEGKRTDSSVVVIQSGGKILSKDVRAFLSSAGGRRPNAGVVSDGNSTSGGLNQSPSPPRLPPKQTTFAAASRALREEEKFVQLSTAGSVKKLRDMQKKFANVS
jgi:hypothetical protein